MATITENTKIAASDEIIARMEYYGDGMMKGLTNVIDDLIRVADKVACTGLDLAESRSLIAKKKDFSASTTVVYELDALRRRAEDIELLANAALSEIGRLTLMSLLTKPE